MNIRMPDAAADVLERVAREAGMTQSRYVLRMLRKAERDAAVRAALDDMRANPEPPDDDVRAVLDAGTAHHHRADG